MNLHFLWSKTSQILHLLFHVFLWPLKNLPPSQPCGTALPHVFLEIDSGPWPLTIPGTSPQECFCLSHLPPGMFIFYYWNLIWPHYWHFFILQESLLLSKQRQLNERCWQRRPIKQTCTSPLFSVPSSPDSRVPRGRRKLRRSPELCIGEQAKYLPEQVSFCLFKKRWILPK